MRRAILIACAVVLVTSAVPSAFGQGNAEPRGSAPQANEGKVLAYDVASIRPNKSGEGRRIQLLPDGVSYTNITLQFVLRQAFGVEDGRIIGVPGWVKTDVFDIEAKVEPSDAPRLKGLKPEQRWQMMLPVLEERCNLKFHHDNRELPIYALVIAKSGLKLKEARPDDTYPNGFKGPNGAMGAGGFQRERGKITGQGVPIAMLLGALSLSGMDRTIFDKTGLTGKYDFTLEWTPDDAPPAMTGGAPPPDAGEPSLFTALEEQLGLKLEPQKGPVDVIAIDHIERPSAN